MINGIAYYPHIPDNLAFTGENMMVLDGRELAATMLARVTEEVARFDTPPALATVLLGDDRASMIYVKRKRDACNACGIVSRDYDLPQTTTEVELLTLIDQLNIDPQINGILVQLPLPVHINLQRVLDRIAIDKDVDGFHPFNLGMLAAGTPRLRPCTPFGIMELLKHYHIDVHGKNALVIGASLIVGRPMLLELLAARASVSICHRDTKDLAAYVKMAEIIIVATGVMDVINSKWLNDRHIIIEVGIHRMANGKIRGDVDFATAADIVAAITPVPGGVGPVTIATLLQNTLLARELQS